MEGDAFETVTTNTWEEESPTEESESNKRTTDAIGETTCEELESYLDERQTKGAFVEKKNTVSSLLNVESEEPISEDLRFEVDGTQETKTRCRVGVFLLLGILLAAMGIETYFFVKILHERDNEMRKLTENNERLGKANRDLEQRLKEANRDLEERLTEANRDLEQRLTEADRDLEILTEANRDLKKRLTEAINDLDENKQSENQNGMQTLANRNEFLDGMKELSRGNSVIRNHALYVAVYTKSMDTIQYLLELGANPTFEFLDPTLVSGTSLERSALKLAASESSETSSEMMMILCQSDIIIDAVATETLNFYIKTNSPDALIVNRLIEKNAMPLASYQHQTNTFTMALHNANVGVPVYQTLVRAAQAHHESIPKILLREAYSWKFASDQIIPFKSLHNLILALEEVHDENDKKDAQNMCQSGSVSRSFNFLGETKLQK